MQYAFIASLIRCIAFSSSTRCHSSGLMTMLSETNSGPHGQLKPHVRNIIALALHETSLNGRLL